MEKIIIEVGSTVTKVDLYDGEDIKRLEEKTILFKKNYGVNHCLNEEDVLELVQIVKKYLEKMKKYDKFYILKLDISKYFWI